MGKASVVVRLGQPGWILLFLLCSTVGLAFTASARAVDNAEEPTGRINFAPVVVNGEELFEVVGIRSFPAKKRAKKFAENIEAAAEDESLDPADITIVELENKTEIVLGDKTLMFLLDAEALHLGVDSRQVLAEAYRNRIAEGIEAYRLDRTPERLRNTIIQVVLRTLVLVAVLVVLRRLFKVTDRYVEKVFKRRVRKLEAKSMRMIQSEQILRVITAVLNLVKTVLVLGLIYVFLNFVLKLFPWTRYLADNLLEWVINPLQVMASGFIDYLPSLFFLIILFLITRYLLRLLRGFFDAVHNQNMRLKDFDPEWAWPTYRIIRLIVVVFAVVIAYPYIPGSESDAFKGVSLFMGVLLSLGSTSVISNIIAGYTMTYRRAFKAGDRIRVGETIGEVLDSRLLVTHLNSLKNERIIIPNSTILNSEIINYSSQEREKGLILHTQVGIGYEVPWRQVEAMLIEAAARTEDLLQDPPPFVLQQALTDFAVTYELNVYCSDATKMMRLYSELHRHILDVFNEYGVQIMTPNYVADTPDPKLVPAAEWYPPPVTKPGDQG